MPHIPQFIRTHSLLSGIASGALVAILTAGIIVSNVSHTSAATANGCDGSSRPSIQEGDRGNCVTLAQQLLAQQGYFNAGVTGYYGPVTKQAVLDLQRDRGLNQLGLIGPKTWAALDGSTSGGTGTTVSDASSLPSNCLTNTKTICIVKSYGSHATLYAVQNQQIVRSFPVRTGDARGPEYATEVGTYSVGRRYTMWHSTIYNNAEMPYSLFFNGGEAIHYSHDFDVNGYGGIGSSAGCVNVGSMDDAQWLYDWSPLYTRVVVTD